MRIDGVSLNRPLNRAQGTIKKVSGVSKPLTMAVEELPHNDLPAETETVRGADLTLSKITDWIPWAARLMSGRD